MAELLPLSPVPLYTQLKELLRERILDGSYPPHSRMPSESELGKAFDVSRITVRQALGDLQKEGLLFKLHGKGTFVSKPKAFQNVTSPKSCSADVIRPEDLGSYTSQAASGEIHVQALRRPVPSASNGTVASRSTIVWRVAVSESGTAMGVTGRGTLPRRAARSCSVAISFASRFGSSSGIRRRAASSVKNR